MNKRVLPVLLATVISFSALAGCSSKSSSATKTTRSGSGSASAAAGVSMYATSGSNSNSYYEAESTVAADVVYDDIDWSYESADEGYDALNEDISGQQGSKSTSGNGSNADTKVDISKEMLVYRCSIALDTMEFEQTLTALKTKIQEYHGFIERENQTDGSRNQGRYALSEEEKDYYYTATIRIPSSYYESFVSATEGIGTLRSKSSSVDNVATRYGTLKNELEIYQAEYDRLMKQYESTQDEKIALQIQRELRELALSISDMKTEMSMLESDVAYSYVSITIHKVTQKEVKEQEKVEQEVKEDDSFSTRLSKTASQSWGALVGFGQDIVLAIVAGWWIILLIAIIVLVLFLFIKHKVKKAKAKRAERKALQEEQALAEKKAQEERRLAAQKEQEEKRAENHARIQARIAAQQDAARQQEEAVMQAKDEQTNDTQTTPSGLIENVEEAQKEEAEEAKEEKKED